MLLGFGVLGYVMRLFGYPIAPIVVGLILGPMADSSCAGRWRSARATGCIWCSRPSPPTFMLLRWR